MPDQTQICIVDDVPEQLEMLSRMLITAGYTTQSFVSGKAFLNQTNFNEISCLLLDNQMPEISGLDVQHELIRRKIHIPIIFMSGDTDYGEVVNAVHQGALGFLQKPFTLGKLLEEVETALTENSKRLEEDVQSNSLDILTRRETQVFELVIAGHTNKAIASELNIAVSTVEFHRSNLVTKLGVHSLADLMSLAKNSKKS
jgi:FixJ family two-component response regulator